MHEDFQVLTLRHGEVGQSSALPPADSGDQRNAYLRGSRRDSGLCVRTQIPDQKNLQAFCVLLPTRSDSDFNPGHRTLMVRALSIILHRYMNAL